MKTNAQLIEDILSSVKLSNKNAELDKLFLELAFLDRKTLVKICYDCHIAVK